MMELVRPADGHRPAEFLAVPGEDPGCSDDLCQLFASPAFRCTIAFHIVSEITSQIAAPRSS
jgi:hypothetical protein